MGRAMGIMKGGPRSVGGVRGTSTVSSVHRSNGSPGTHNPTLTGCVRGDGKRKGWGTNFVFKGGSQKGTKRMEWARLTFEKKRGHVKGRRPPGRKESFKRSLSMETDGDWCATNPGKNGERTNTKTSGYFWNSRRSGRGRGAREVVGSDWSGIPGRNGRDWGGGGGGGGGGSVGLGVGGDCCLVAAPWPPNFQGAVTIPFLSPLPNNSPRDERKSLIY